MNTKNREYQIVAAIDKIKKLLLKKNDAYGDSALSPLSIFSSASAEDGIRQRIDDKLKRIKNAGLVDATEDTLQDLAGYLILLMIAKDNASNDIQKRLRQDKPTLHSTTTSVGADPDWEVEYFGDGGT